MRKLPFWKRKDFDNHLKDIFCDWLAKGDIDFNLLSAFDSTLRIAGYKDPRQTIQSWIRIVQEQVADALKMSISELDFLDIDLSVELDQLDVEESFFRFYAHSHNEADQLMSIKHTTGTRLVVCQASVDGYSFLSLMRASSVVNCQFTVAPRSFLRLCHVWISCFKVSWSAIRLERHCRDSTESSISAIFSQLPCFGV